jgi:hypothetical protein
MFYAIKAYVEGTNSLVKSREMRGYDWTAKQVAIWERQGYEVTVTMLCTKYIEVARIANPKSLAPKAYPKSI